MQTFLDKVIVALERLPIASATADFAVAYSGGLDSTVLLHALTRVVAPGRLRALHVDHGLHADSLRWAQHCCAQAQALAVRYESRRVDVAADLGNTEALARAARYRALGEMLQPGEVLLTAHHADDQLETLLLRLLRGAGVTGLRGVIEHSVFARGHIARPLLGIARTDIRRQAELWRLAWLEDPSNGDPRFDRNFLRLDMLGALNARWPAGALNAARAARQMCDAEEILTAMAQSDLGAVELPGPLPCACLAPLSSARQRNLLRYAIARHGLPVPSAAQLEQLRAALGVERRDAQTQVRWADAQARIYRGRLYLLALQGPRTRAVPAGWLGPQQPWSGLEGVLALEPVPPAQGLAAELVHQPLEVRFRSGGERMPASGGRPGHSLKHWLQEAGVVPWMRDRIPLLYARERLVAVADLWLDSTYGEPQGPRWRVRWSEHPSVF
jgi:tRNA(Ile)-lysidine synthase